ncbi:MAG TPA: hypothetical protein VFW04_10570 [Gemmatimonadaceae bacterium]|nr:hypothetical protein [Gemmatimonadaceae bacterium]
MVDKPPAAETKAPDLPPAAPPAQPGVPRRAPGHRSTDARDTVAEMALRAQEISQEAGSKIAQAIKDVINAAAGLAGFAIESARDIVQYMVRRGQMTQEEADRIIREVEEAHGKRKPAAKQAASPPPIAAVPEPPIKKIAPPAAAEKAPVAPPPAPRPDQKAAKTAHAAHTASRPAGKKHTAASHPKTSAKKAAKKKR